ncbi:MAG: hypothetical protein GVY13_16215 [Alphaproteobacteria bacterium]|jgi:hypothetical protein|nr:hypothetical protein [Alphaproteobacteria bacterium]
MGKSEKKPDHEGEGPPHLRVETVEDLRWAWEAGIASGRGRPMTRGDAVRRLQQLLDGQNSNS